jgi:hypothetical protein
MYGANETAKSSDIRKKIVIFSSGTSNSVGSAYTKCDELTTLFKQPSFGCGDTCCLNTTKESLRADDTNTIISVNMGCSGAGCNLLNSYIFF